MSTDNDTLGPVDQAAVRPVCPDGLAWCVRHPDNPMYTQHWSETRNFVMPDFWTIKVDLSKTADNPVVLHVGSVRVPLDDRSDNDADDVIKLLRRLGHEDIAAAAEELAAMVTP